MKIVNLILSIILIITIPVSIICLSNNLTTRMPDLYQYELKSTEVLADLSIDKSEDELGKLFSDYMLGKTDTFQIEYQFGDNTDKLFTNDEQKTMSRFRSMNNTIFFVGMDALLLLLISYFLLYKQNLKPLIRNTFVKAGIVYGVLVGAILIITLIAPLMNFQYEFLFNYEVKTFMVLPKLITRDFFVHLAYATVIIGTIVMGLGWYFTWKITKPRRIFGALR